MLASLMSLCELADVVHGKQSSGWISASVFSLGGTVYITVLHKGIILEFVSPFLSLLTALIQPVMVFGLIPLSLFFLFLCLYFFSF